MYQITYKNKLKPHRKIEDFQNWQTLYWPVHQAWGAVSYRVWQEVQGQDTILNIQYMVNDLTKWNGSNLSVDSVSVLQSLKQIVDLNHLSIKITRVPQEFVMIFPN